MKIISWNVNWIRAVAKKWFKDFVTEENPDIVCIQETKAFEEQFLKEVWELEWYKYIWHSGTRAWYAGTAIFYKDNLEVIDTKNHFWDIEHFHSDWRITEVEFKDFVLINGYYPNGWQKVTQENMLDYKLEFYDHIINYSKNLLAEWKDIILTWDFNICHTEIDIARPKENKNSIWFLPVEREKVWELLSNGFIDTFRHFYPEQLDTYSWWSYRAWARPRNVWWRIDYFVVNNNFIEKVSDIKYLTDVMGSDHCPLLLELK
jgi:exodeoxyribonuclease-3